MGAIRDLREFTDERHFRLGAIREMGPGTDRGWVKHGPIRDSREFTDGRARPDRGNGGTDDGKTGQTKWLWRAT